MYSNFERVVKRVFESIFERVFERMFDFPLSGYIDFAVSVKLELRELLKSDLVFSSYLVDG